MGGYSGFVPGGTATLEDVITGFGRQKGEAEAAQAQPDLIRQQTALTGQQTEDARLRNRIAQRQLRDEEIQRSIFGEVGKSASTPTLQSVAPPPTAGQGTQAPGMIGVTTGDLQPAPQAPPPERPNYLSDPRAFASEMAKRGASAPAVMGAYKTIIDLNKNLAGLSKDQLEVEEKDHGMVAASLQGYLNTPDAQKPQAYAQFYQDAITREPNLKSELPPPAAGTAPSQDDLAHVIGKVHLFGTLLANAKEKQATQTSAAQEKETVANTGKITTERDIAQFKFNLMRNPGSVDSSVDSIIDPVKYPDQNKIAKAEAAAALKATGDPKDAAEVVRRVADGILDVKKEDLMRPGKVQTAVETAKATAPIEVGKAVQTAYATIGAKVKEQVDAQKALALNAPGSFSGIIEPSARHAAEQEYDKATDAYHDKAMAAQNVKSLIDAALSGNKAAPALIPIAELRTFVGRVNRSELQGISGAGSSLDKLQGWLEGKTEGQPIPPDILKATAQIADIQQKDASQRYDLALAKLKQKGANPPRIELPGGGLTSVKAGGKEYHFDDQASADAFKAAAKAKGVTVE